MLGDRWSPGLEKDRRAGAGGLIVAAPSGWGVWRILGL